MSLWTPGGEHPVDRNSPDPASDSAPGADPSAARPDESLSPEQRAEAEQIASEMQAVRQQLSQVPAAVVVANHAMGCYELAAIHLSNQPPRLEEARLAIDAFAALLGAVEGRLGDDEPTLQDALAQIRLAFVQVQAASAPAGSPGEEPSPSESTAEADTQGT
jgi:hypothetical protein